MRFHPSSVTAALVAMPAILLGQTAPAPTTAAPSPQVAYQGRLTEAGLPATGARSFTFSILDAQGNELWNSGAQDVSVNNGLYAVELGGTGMPAIPASLLGTPGLKLRLAINGVTLTPDTDLVPALQARSAFAFSGPLAGDVSGTQNATLVVRLQGVPVDATVPSAGQALVFNGTSWAPATAAGPAGPQGPQGLAGMAGPQGPIGLTGAPGPAGIQGPAGTNGLTILNGTGAPAATLGVDGDFYLDTAASVLYGPKGALTAEAWPAAGLSLVGPTGPQGPIGLQGPQGSIGLTGPVGPAGATGPQGLQGSQGIPGASPFTLSGSNAVFPTGALGVGTSAPDASALLDLTSTTQGLLAPRMTSAQRLAIATPATGLVVYDTTLGDLQEFNGASWVTPGSSAIASNLTWLGSVIGFSATAPPPSTGSRYIATADWLQGSGGTSSNPPNAIATYNGTAWVFTTPTAQDAVFATSQANGYVYNGTAWVPFTPSSLAQLGATANQVLTWNGTAWAPSTPVNGGGTVTSIATTGPLTGGPITTTGTLGITKATASTDGYLAAADFAAFAAKGYGSVTSVGVSGGTTGLTTSGGPISGSGTITLGGTLAVANGGTGMANPGASGNVLTSNGSTWVSAPPTTVSSVSQNLANIALLRWGAAPSYAVGNTPIGVAFDGINIWVTNDADNTVSKLLAATGALVGTYPVGTSPEGIAFDGTNIWVANYSDATVSKLLAATGATVGTYAVGMHPYGVAFDGTNIWVADGGNASVTKLLAGTGALVGTYPVGTNPHGVAFDGTNIWVANLGDSTVSKLLATTGALVGTYPVGNSPQGVAFDGTNIWVANEGSSTVSKLLATTGALVGTYPVGSHPIGVAFDGTNIWVANNGSNTVSKLLAATGALVGTYPVGSLPSGVAFDGTNIWVTDGNSTVSAISAR